MRDIDEGLTLSRVADRAEIEELVAAYSHRLDDRDWAGWAELFTEDGCYQSRVGPAFKGDLAGVAERNLGALEGSHHMLGQHSITLDGDEARGRCYYIGIHVRHAAHPSQCDVVAGWYHHRYRRTLDGWRFVEVRSTPSWSAGGDFWEAVRETIGAKA
ncbi:nuclear transport factor 2 family protein [uncultured Brevundimonas sp.]|uniref:nuclear transport factor 2 family protein n=1 Tax=uncultured Brevundimonas sp. TaxID=213418 RepID=UPI0025D529CE|nr:nuclear transport factor 2 family protein [uncultured Brevundimonas sp.]